MINGRAKGHAFEREIIKLFHDEFGDCAAHLKRVLDQYQEKGRADIEFNNLAIECKRYASGSWHKPEWWTQCCESAQGNHVPILIYKFDRQPIRFVFRLSDILIGPQDNKATATVDLPTGLMLMRELLEF